MVVAWSVLGVTWSVLGVTRTGVAVVVAWSVLGVMWSVLGVTWTGVAVVVARRILGVTWSVLGVTRTGVAVVVARRILGDWRGDGVRKRLLPALRLRQTAALERGRTHESSCELRAMLLVTWSRDNDATISCIRPRLASRGVVLKKKWGTPETRLRQRFTVT